MSDWWCTCRKRKDGSNNCRLQSWENAAKLCSRHFTPGQIQRAIAELTPDCRDRATPAVTEVRDE